MLSAPADFIYDSDNRRTLHADLRISLPGPSVMTTITLDAPAWLIGWQEAHAETYPDIEDRMRLAIELSAINVEQDTGGPFGAIIFNRNSGKLISAGVNRVVACAASIAHAEIMAITAAQQQLGVFDLSAPIPSCELVTSCEPCTMCFGAIPWSGIRHLVCAARDADARAIGFDEGPKMTTWQQQLESRGITVQTDLCRHDAAAILQHYANHQGPIYNGREQP